MRGAPSFRTVGTELEEAATAAVYYFRDKGYGVLTEPFEFDYPTAPTVMCKRGRARLIIEAVVDVNMSSLDAWLGYARSRDSETSLAVLVVDPPGLSLSTVVELRQRKVGVYSYGSTGIVELLAPTDLSVAVPLPPLDGLKSQIRRRLQPCFDKVERGEWLDGFRDSCQILEAAAVEHLKDGVKRGRVTFVTPSGKQKVYTLQQIGRMPQGALAKAYGEIFAPTQIDSALAKALDRLNRDRIKAVHKTDSAKHSRALRSKIGQHMWTVVSALKQLS